MGEKGGAYVKSLLTNSSTVNFARRAVARVLIRLSASPAPTPCAPSDNIWEAMCFDLKDYMQEL